MSKLLSDKQLENQTSKHFEDKLTIQNSTSFFYFSRLFQLPELSKLSLGVVERWFTTIANSKNFLELDFINVAKVLNSSELLVDSELQVFNAANAWLNHKRVVRSKHSKYLLQRVRLSLLTVPALKSVLDRNLWIKEKDEYSNIFKKAIEKKLSPNSYKVLSTNRYCSQENFNFIIAGGFHKSKPVCVRDVYSVDAKNYSSLNSFPALKKKRSANIVCIKGELYMFGGVDESYNIIKSVEKYSPTTNAWNVIGTMPKKLTDFCTCSFINKVYCIGGTRSTIGNSCTEFNTTKKSWRELADMRNGRKDASCVVFQGRVTVLGGCNHIGRELRSIEAYDHVDGSWSHSWPQMIKRRSCHESVAIKNKLFAIGGLDNDTAEVFDSSCNKFVLLKQPSGDLDEHVLFMCDVTSVGSSVVIFSTVKGKILLYDVENDVWSERKCDANQRIRRFSCAKLPKL